MEWLLSDDFDIARFLITRGVGLIYAVAFIGALAQFPALLGERGLVPVPKFLARMRAAAAPRGGRSGRGRASGVGPSLFRWRYSDALLRMTAILGLVIALTVVLGLVQAGPWWLVFAAFGLLYLLYLSIVNVGQVFYGFGWESLLLEAGFLAAFLGSDRVGTPLVAIIAIKWLVFRLEFGAGLIKLRGDRVWRDLTALYYHHETQPMPGPASWFFHHLPRPLHKVEAGANFVVQLAVPVLLFAPQPVASWAAIAVIVTQLWLVVSGNFAWLNWLTIFLACAGLSDRVVAQIAAAVGMSWQGSAAAGASGGVGEAGGAGEVGSASEMGALGGQVGIGNWGGTEWSLIIASTAMAGLVLVLSRRPLLNLFSRHQLMNASYNRWHLVNSYGAFGSIAKQRREVVIEGTLDPDPAHADWLEYEVRGKPGDPRRRPVQVAPYHLRLGWGMWFLALGSTAQLAWFYPLLDRLLGADRGTLKLFSFDPFAGDRPRWVRARVYEYRFSSWQQLREDRCWWTRRELFTLVDPIGQS